METRVGKVWELSGGDIIAGMGEQPGGGRGGDGDTACRGVFFDLSVVWGWKGGKGGMGREGSFVWGEGRGGGIYVPPLLS